MEPRLKVAVIGCGRHGRYQMELVSALSDELELVAVCDRDRGRLRDASQAVGPGVYATRNFDEVPRRRRPDFAIIAILPHLSPPVCQRFLEAGVPVLTEVPPAFDGLNAEGMIEAAKERGLPFGACEQYVFTPIERLKQKLIREGVLGRIDRVRVEGSVHHHGHEVAVTRSYLAPDAVPVRIRANGAGLSYPTIPPISPRNEEGVQIPALLYAEVEFDSGVLAEFLLSERCRYGPALPLAGVDREIHGSEGGFREGRFYLRRGNPAKEVPLELTTRLSRVGGVEVVAELSVDSDPPVSWQNPLADRAWPRAEQLPSHPYVDDFPRAWDTAGAHLLLNMADAVRGKSALDYPVEKAMTDTRIRLAMLESDRRKGAWIPWSCEPFPIEREMASFKLYRFLKRFDLRPLPPIERSR